MKKKSYIGEGKIKQKCKNIFRIVVQGRQNKKSSYINWLMKNSHAL